MNWTWRQVITELEAQSGRILDLEDMLRLHIEGHRAQTALLEQVLHELKRQRGEGESWQTDESAE